MSAKSEEEYDFEQDPLSLRGEDADDALAKIVEHIAATALDSNEQLSPEAEFQIGIRTAGERQDILRELVGSVCPDNVNPKLWETWLRGGKSPFGNGKLVKTGTEAEKPNLTMSRGTSRVRKQEGKIEVLKAELEREENRLDYFRAIEKAALHWHVTDQLLRIVAPVFAMGPAWTVMRALSGHPPEKLVDDMTSLFDGKAKDSESKKFREEYAEETAQLLVGLDFFSGIEEFEQRLRSAIKEVVDEFDERKDEVVLDGRRRRSSDRMMASPNPEAIEDANEVLLGFE